MAVGAVEEIRARFAGDGATLEDVFFLATEDAVDAPRA